MRTLLTKGPMGIWEMVKAALSLYRGVVFLIENKDMILDTVEGVLNSVAAVASGKLGNAAKFIEKNMARGLTLMLLFLAKFLKLDGISKVMRNILEKIRKPINRALDVVIVKVIRFAGRFLRKIKKSAKNLKEKIKNFKDGRLGSVQNFPAGKENHRLWIAIKNKKPVVMMASDEGPVERFLTRTDVRRRRGKLKATDGKFAVNEAENLLKDTNVSSKRALISLINDKKSDAERHDATTESNEIKLAKYLKTILTALDEFRPNYPLVGTYSELVSVEKSYTPHHVPPKSLANFIYLQIDKLPDSTKRLKAVQPYVEAANLAKEEHDGKGTHLSCILVHENTHLIEGEIPNIDYRIHGGAKTEEAVREEARKNDIEPRLNEKEKVSLSIRQNQLEKAMELTTNADLKRVLKNVRNKQIQDFEQLAIRIRVAFQTANIQSRAAVKFALANSVGKDGNPQSQKRAMNELTGNGKLTWITNLHPAMRKLTRF